MAGVLWRSRARDGLIAARMLLSRSFGSVTFKVDAEAASHMASLAAAEAKARGAIAGAGVGAEGQKMCKSKLLYYDRVIPALAEEFGYTKRNQIPFLEKIVVYCNFRLDRTDTVVLESTVRDMYILTGQRPTITKARQAISGSSYRVGDPVGCKVTLRGEMMYPFMDKLLNLVVPKSRTLQGLTTYGFRKERYNLGTKDYSSLSENRLEHILESRGLKIAIVTGANSRDESKKLLLLMGLPYIGMSKRRKPKDKKGRRGVRVSAAAVAAKKGSSAKKGKGAAKPKKKK